MPLDQLIRDKRVVVCVGSGGVGKTTIAATLALHAASEGRRVLCMTIDPARRLANAMGLGEMRSEMQRVGPERFSAAGIPLAGTLDAMMLDTRRTFDELIARHAPNATVRDRILNNRLYGFIATSLAGTQEYMAMEKLYALREDGRFDLLVLDTPPTPNALDFLDAPQRMVEAIDSPATRWISGVGLGGGLSKALGRGASFLLRALSRFTGAKFLREVGAFVEDVNVLFGGFRERASRVYETLRSADVSFVVVTSADPLAIDEAAFFAGRLSAAKMPFGAIVANRIRQLPQGAPVASRDEAVHLLVDGDGADRRSDLAAPLWQAWRDAQALARADLAQLGRLRGAGFGDVPMVVVPELEEEIHDLGGLDRVARYVFGEEAR